MVCSHIFGPGSGYRVLTIIRLLAPFSFFSWQGVRNCCNDRLHIAKGIDYCFDTPIHDGTRRVTGFCEIIGWFSVLEGW